MHATCTPPGPNLFGHERQEGREQAQQSIQGGCQSSQNRSLLLLAASTVRTVLNQLNEVVGEGPEEALANLQGTSVLVLLECGGCFLNQVRQASQQGTVQSVDQHTTLSLRSNHGLLGSAQVQHELGCVQQLDGKAAANLHLAFVVGGVSTQASRSSPVAYSVRTVLLQYLVGDHNVALRLGHLLAVRVENPAGERGVVPRHGGSQGLRANSGGEQPGADNVVTLRAQIHGEGLRMQVRVHAPTGRNLRGQGGGSPGVQNVRVSDEAARYATLILGVTGSSLRCGVNRQHLFGRQNRVLVVRLALSVQRVPDGEGNAEETLARNQPVAVQALNPVLVAATHEGGVPVHLTAALDELLAACSVTATVADVPLTGSNDFEGLVALLVELHGVGNRLGVAVHFASLNQHLHDGLLCGEDGGACHALVALATLGGGDPLGGFAGEAAVATDESAGVQLQFTPPGDVGGVTEGTDHGDTGTLVGLCQRVRLDFDLNAEQRGGDGGAEQRLVTLVVRVRHESHTGGQQLGAGGLNPDLLAVGAVEADAVVRAGAFLVFQLSLCHCGAESDVPHGRCFSHVGVACFQVLQEGELGDLAGVRVDGAVGARPVNGQTQGGEEVFEDLLVFNRELFTEFNEVVAGDTRPLCLAAVGLGGAVCLPGDQVTEGVVVCHGGVAENAVVVLNAAFGGQAVVIPAEGVEHVLAGHALVACNDVGLGVGEHVTHVQGAGCGRRRGVNGVDLFASGVLVECVGLLVGPALRELLFEAFEGGAVGNVNLYGRV